ncbi:hypothetical protein HELRODRAFT_190235 [Helobdella robusta]|uniref:WW domain-containing protein n=1 Tax=Helobdella robusta TaxID=6412 RepID=T1FRT0_HELRO|nr:hypothetical protein HELRODRAFT_190235 [Helobdella robusta]ESO10931.1 hypothetical protein HELRODRAFT_190235 [Helobdella robusta]
MKRRQIIPKRKPIVQLDDEPRTNYGFGFKSVDLGSKYECLPQPQQNAANKNALSGLFSQYSQDSDNDDDEEEDDDGKVSRKEILKNADFTSNKSVTKPKSMGDIVSFVRATTDSPSSQKDDSPISDVPHPVVDSGPPNLPLTSNLSIKPIDEIDSKLLDFFAEIESLDTPADTNKSEVDTLQIATTIKSDGNEKELQKSNAVKTERINSPTRNDDIKNGIPTETNNLKHEHGRSIVGGGGGGDGGVVQDCPPPPPPKPQLPQEPTCDWQAVLDDNTNCYYYWNGMTGESRWDIPAEYSQFLLLYREYEASVAKFEADMLAWKQCQEKYQKYCNSRGITYSASGEQAEGSKKDNTPALANNNKSVVTNKCNGNVGTSTSNSKKSVASLVPYNSFIDDDDEDDEDDDKKKENACIKKDSGDDKRDVRMGVEDVSTAKKRKHDSLDTDDDHNQQRRRGYDNDIDQQQQNFLKKIKKFKQDDLVQHTIDGESLFVISDDITHGIRQLEEVFSLSSEMQKLVNQLSSDVSSPSSSSSSPMHLLIKVQTRIEDWRSGQLNINYLLTKLRESYEELLKLQQQQQQNQKQQHKQHDQTPKEMHQSFELVNDPIYRRKRVLSPSNGTRNNNEDVSTTDSSNDPLPVAGCQPNDDDDFNSERDDDDVVKTAHSSIDVTQSQPPLPLCELPTPPLPPPDSPNLSHQFATEGSMDGVDDDEGEVGAGESSCTIIGPSLPKHFQMAAGERELSSSPQPPPTSSSSKNDDAADDGDAFYHRLHDNGDDDNNDDNDNDDNMGDGNAGCVDAESVVTSLSSLQTETLANHDDDADTSTSKKTKKRAKALTSSGLSLKKKKVESLVAKWKKVEKDVSREVEKEMIKQQKIESRLRGETNQ